MIWARCWMLDTGYVLPNFDIRKSVFDVQYYLGKITPNKEHPTPNFEDVAA